MTAPQKQVGLVAGADSAVVIRVADQPCVTRSPGVTTTAMVTQDRGATSFLNGITQFEPGTAIAHHSHNCAESVIVVEGRAVVDIAGVETPLAQGDVTFIPGGTAHRFRNPSPADVLRIFWTYGSTDATRTLMATGQTTRVDAELSAVGPPSAVVDIELSCRPR